MRLRVLELGGRVQAYNPLIGHSQSLVSLDLLIKCWWAFLQYGTFPILSEHSPSVSWDKLHFNLLSGGNMVIKGWGLWESHPSHTGLEIPGVGLAVNEIGKGQVCSPTVHLGCMFLCQLHVVNNGPVYIPLVAKETGIAIVHCSFTQRRLATAYFMKYLLIFWSAIDYWCFPNQTKAIICLCDPTSRVCDRGDLLLHLLFERLFYRHTITVHLSHNRNSTNGT